ncbi:hypothetical protein PILCRDRAFT_814478 [Piloderma croceum F 1598]|uniref:CXC domain-containing protein n=1 Tax=Piloderma croceum (strain F 1598) TaxID=765440 RepID=A0A0C3CDH8_PILCF|nr:hypothetical protein PILCRDRAFT_814478 [Piloderma croceum F 1598]
MAEIESLDSDNSLDRTEPVDGLAGFEQDFNRRTAGIKELGTSVYRECWDEFYRWEPGECQQLIVALPPDPSDSADFEELIDVLSSDSGAWDRDRGSTMDVDPPTSETVVTVTIYDRDNSFSQVLIPFDEVVVIAAFAPHTTYESCPPTSKNIARRLDQPTEAEKTRFIPYADEGFDAEEYAAEYQSFSWQVDFKDPDLEVIQLETARRLHFGHKLSFAEIDGLSFLLPLRMSSYSGLLWNTFQRDILKWPGTYNPHLSSFTSTFEDDQNGEAQIRLRNDLQVRLGTLLETFCPNLNCVQAACTMHTGTNIYPEIPNIHRSTYEPVKPRLTNQDIRRSEGTHCGEECFRATISDDLTDQLCWDDPVDLMTLKTILDISPDLSPCDLAVLCRKPCREIYVQRMIIYKDDVISDDAQLQESLKKSRASRRGRKPKKMEDVAHMSFTPRPPCKHKGACDANSGCSCFRQKHHCQRNCQCGSECERRWKGCKCQKKPERKPCGSKCKCVMANRECDVDLCKPCHAR